VVNVQTKSEPENLQIEGFTDDPEIEQKERSKQLLN
jgi:hypothetical protein